MIFLTIDHSLSIQQATFCLDTGLKLSRIQLLYRFKLMLLDRKLTVYIMNIISRTILLQTDCDHLLIIDYFLLC